MAGGFTSGFISSGILVLPLLSSDSAKKRIVHVTTLSPQRVILMPTFLEILFASCTHVWVNIMTRPSCMTDNNIMIGYIMVILISTHLSLDLPLSQEFGLVTLQRRELCACHHPMIVSPQRVILMPTFLEILLASCTHVWVNIMTRPSCMTDNNIMIGYIMVILISTHLSLDLPLSQEFGLVTLQRRELCACHHPMIVSPQRVILMPTFLEILFASCTHVWVNIMTRPSCMTDNNIMIGYIMVILINTHLSNYIN